MDNCKRKIENEQDQKEENDPSNKQLKLISDNSDLSEDGTISIENNNDSAGNIVDVTEQDSISLTLNNCAGVEKDDILVEKIEKLANLTNDTQIEDAIKSFERSISSISLDKSDNEIAPANVSNENLISEQPTNMTEITLENHTASQIEIARYKSLNMIEMYFENNGLAKESKSSESSIEENDVIPVDNDNAINECNSETNKTLQNNARKINIDSYFKEKSLIELSRFSWGRKNQPYLKGCLWSPDSTCCLVPVNNSGMYVIELPYELHGIDTIPSDRSVDLLHSAVVVKGSSTVYDFCWYPLMNSHLPETCCWISSRQHEPIQMWDAFDGCLRCTYRGYDAVDEVESAISVCFSLDGQEIYAGYKKSIKIFKTSVPGRDCTDFRLKFPVSAITINTSEHEQQGSEIVIGSWNKNIYLYDFRSNAIVDTLIGHTHGVTYLKYTPNGKLLFSGARKDDQLLGWDMRNTKVPVFNLKRNICTNQRIYFDINSTDKWLVSGDYDGYVHVWDLNGPSYNGRLNELKFKVHNDCCTGVSFHPNQPILATSSGKHTFENVDGSAGSINQENSLIFWWYGEIGKTH